jgi:hypothetical protein
MSREDFLQWKSNPVTEAFFPEIRQIAEGVTEELVVATDEREHDIFRKGYIRACRDILEAEIE